MKCQYLLVLGLTFACACCSYGASRGDQGDARRVCRPCYSPRTL